MEKSEDGYWHCNECPQSDDGIACIEPIPGCYRYAFGRDENPSESFEPQQTYLRKGICAG